jgi:hypothetical protein
MKKLKGLALNRCLGVALAAFACVVAIAFGVYGITAKKASAEEYAPSATTVSLDAEDTEGNSIETEEPAAEEEENSGNTNKTRQANPIAQSQPSQQKGVPIWVAIVCGLGAMCAAMVVAGICISISNKEKWHK